MKLYICIRSDSKFGQSTISMKLGLEAFIRRRSPGDHVEDSKETEFF